MTCDAGRDARAALCRHWGIVPSGDRAIDLACIALACIRAANHLLVRDVEPVTVPRFRAERVHEVSP